MSQNKVKAVVNAIQKFYPVRLADKSWDNTGLLVDASSEAVVTNKVKVLLAVDLTQEVCNEAIESKANIIMAYHPFIFRGLKSITPQDPQQRSLLKLIQNNVSVYSPHTAIDSAKGGVNDYLADGITEGLQVSSKEAIEPNTDEDGTGMGRIITIAQPASLSTLVANAKKSLGLAHLQVGTPNNPDRIDSIQKIAVCAGSGSGVFKGVDADLYYTGELSHHEALFYTQSGSAVIACNHSNTERPFLKVVKQQLESELPDAEISISKTDRDPLEIW